MAAVSTVPVVNMLSDTSHPLQALAGALTMRQSLGELAGKVVAWVGDYNNVARSLGEVCALLGAHVRYACPNGFGPDEPELERLGTLGTATVRRNRRPIEAVEGAHAVHSDTWVSMGLEADAAARRRAFEGFSVTTELMQAAAPGAVFLHCLPAHRGLEVHPDVIDGPNSLVFRQGHNRMHTARGALAFVLGGGGNRELESAAPAGDHEDRGTGRHRQPEPADRAAGRRRHRRHPGNGVARSRRSRCRQGESTRRRHCVRRP